MSVKTQFSIKDLENLSGVKAHTIRIWEKRYNLLEPNRTETNIRQYDMLNLKKLLNITFLYNEGYKISKIAQFNEIEINRLIESLSTAKQEDYTLKAFKTSMFDFDYPLFNKTFNEIKEKHTFKEIFYNFFIPLLTEIGALWQTGTIDPAHERFISEIIKQKINLHIHELIAKQDQKEEPKFILFLPYEEIHEIGLLFANFLVLDAGFSSVYLGTNIPIDNLRHLLRHYEDLVFLSYFTVKPDKMTVREYAELFNNKIGNGKKPLWLMGSKVQLLESGDIPNNITIIKSLQDLETILKTF